MAGRPLVILLFLQYRVIILGNHYLLSTPEAHEPKTPKIPHEEDRLSFGVEAPNTRRYLLLAHHWHRHSRAQHHPLAVIQIRQPSLQLEDVDKFFSNTQSRR